MCDEMGWGSVLWCLGFFKQKTAYDMRISDWSSDGCSSDLPEGDAAFLEVGDDRQQVRQRAAEPIELPDNQRVAGVHVVEAGFQAGAIVARTGSLVGVEVPLIDTSGRERIALQIDRLPIIG